MKRLLAVGTMSLLVGLMTGLASGAGTVRLQVEWIVSGRFAPFVIAKEKGFWKKDLLNVDLQRGHGGAGTVKVLTAGSADVVFADTAPALVVRAKGATNKIVAVVYSKAPYMVVAKKKTGIKTPKDVEGKLVGITAGAGTLAIFPAFARVANIDASKVKWEYMTPAAYNPSLLADKVQVLFQYAFDKAFFTLNYPNQFDFMLFGDHGLDIYSSSIQVMESYIRSKPEVVRNFVQGAIRAYVWSAENPEQAAEIFAKYDPTQNRARNLEEVRILNDLIWTADTRKHCVGWIEEAKMEQTKKVMFEAMKVREPLDVKAAYTREFLPCK